MIFLFHNNPIFSFNLFKTFVKHSSVVRILLATVAYWFFETRQLMSIVSGFPKVSTDSPMWNLRAVPSILETDLIVRF
jgi:hypothetical protein